MNPGRNKLWWAFWGGVVLVVGALSWASLTVHLLEERNAVARAENQRQEVIRLALWRMDSRLAPMIALEAARPIEDYEAVLGLQEVAMGFSSSDRSRRSGAGGTLKKIEPGAYSQGFFEIDESGLARGSGTQAKELASKTQQQTQELAASFQDTANMSSDEMLHEVMEGASVAESEVTSGGEAASPMPEPKADYQARQEIATLAQSNQMLSKTSQDDKTKARQYQSKKIAELVDRVDGQERASDLALDVTDQDVWLKDEAQVIVGSIEPRWVTGQDGASELVLVRTVQRHGVPVVQGVWLDWMAMSAELLESINDLLPGSNLYPIGQEPKTMGKNTPVISYRLATVPVAFIPGGANTVDRGSLTPAMLAMLVTWIAVILAMVAVGLVLRTVLTLSARRGRFVGAVTHELRTPLTTFRLYSQMLADGMVTDEAVQKEYLNTLKRESDRLTGIVENVLEYARISRQRGVKDTPKGQQQLTVGELMARIVPPMSRLGEQSGMDLIVSDETGEHIERTVTLDPHAIERIVMNLMDNACKYAGGDGESGEEIDFRVHLDASVSGDSLVLVVADHGPGVPSRDRRKIFGEFVRGSSGTMRDRSGLGLGLALSRGLAVEMGGDLSLVRRRGHGAEFELRVPLDGETKE